MLEWVGHLVVVALIGSIISLALWIWYTYWISPLSSIPNAGPLAPISRLLWAFPTEHRGRITLDLPPLHETHGPLLRIGPNELSFYSIDIYKQVFTVHSPFKKDPRVYGQFVQDEHPGLFSITDPYQHSQRRRVMGQLFNRSKMHLLEGMMIEKVTGFVDVLLQRGTNAFNLVPACRALEADIVSAFGFGQDMGAISAWTEGEELDMVAENDKKSQHIALLSNLPSLTTAYSRLETLIYNLTTYQGRSRAAMQAFDEWSSNRLSHLQSPAIKEKPTKYPNFISTMIRSNIPPLSALSEAKEMLGPGTDTTSATLAHILWALAHDTTYQESLVQQLEIAGWPTDMASLEAVPELRAVVKEGIRWAGAAAAMLPRVVPDEGAVLAGVFVKGGTIINSSPIWYLRDKRAFPDPENFRPSRWLDGASGSARRDEFYIPFSKGSGACIGMHFSYLELYLSVSLILRSFKILLPSWGNSFAASREAILPDRLEWVAAVPTIPLDVQLLPRSERSFRI
ncbi:benzoate 4-monooxygenase cytochrome p450 [Bisporella sp. PMI_857]|nr:benzoate 4-monooxygenase cytochrome p450 [Bisporella sp. PMI_857]